MVPLSITAIDDDDRRTGTRARSKVGKLPSHANYIIDYAFTPILSERLLLIYQVTNREAFKELHPNCSIIPKMHSI